ncbi:MAG: DUF434 domain-containing protein, partial [Sedimentisphaerales bacterium]|nr:DUF434 domain-containing protein [Sedimentisphaerales bacterium]
MPDKRTHRGPHPADARLFAPEALAGLRAALADFSLLLTKGYADKSALKLVGDRFSLTQRQRLAVMRSACSDQQMEARRKCCLDVERLAGRPLAIDGYNLLITVEAAMSGGFLFRGRDGCFRDLASIHGTYRKVEETIPAVTLIGEFLAQSAVPQALWLLDSPVSNSGRLKTLIARLARDHNWNWDIRLAFSPDAELSKTDTIVVTTDSVILDACQKWTNLAAEIITQRLPCPIIIDLA